MKIFQIVNGLCWWDATDTVGTIEKAAEMFAPDCIFVEAPDFVFEGWGYDPANEGDLRFMQPIPPDGFVYDKKSGTFYEINRKTEEQRLEESIEQMKKMLAQAEEQLAAIKSKTPKPTKTEADK